MVREKHNNGVVPWFKAEEGERRDHIQTSFQIWAIQLKYLHLSFLKLGHSNSIF